MLNAKRVSLDLVCLAFLIAIVPFLSGCASIVKGGAQSISVNSTPSDAAVEVFDMDGKKITNGNTPYKISLKTGRGYFKSQDYKLVINKDGYSSKTVYLSSRVSGWYMFGNFGFGGLIGYLIVDPLTGAMWTLDPNIVDVNMGDAVTQNNGEKVLYVVLKNQVPEHLLGKMQLIDESKGANTNAPSAN